MVCKRTCEKLAELLWNELSARRKFSLISHMSKKVVYGVGEIVYMEDYCEKKVKKISLTS